MNDNKNKRNLVLGCILFAAVVIAVIAGAEVATGVSGRKTDTSEGMEIIRKAENADVTEIETKIQKLETRDDSGEEETRSLKERFASTAVIGDSVAEGFLEYDVLNASSVISGTGMDWEKQIEKIKEVNPKVIFLVYCASDILESEGDTNAYIKQYRKRIEEIREAVPEASVFVNSLLDVKRSAFMEETRYKKLDDYNEALQEMCDKLQVGYADNSGLELAQYYEEDGVHFNSEFYPVWAERMAEVASL